MFTKKIQVKLTQDQIDAIVSAIYTQIEVIKGFKKTTEMKDELRYLKQALKALRI